MRQRKSAQTAARWHPASRAKTTLLEASGQALATVFAAWPVSKRGPYRLFDPSSGQTRALREDLLNTVRLEPWELHIGRRARV